MQGCNKDQLLVVSSNARGWVETVHEENAAFLLQLFYEYFYNSVFIINTEEEEEKDIRNSLEKYKICDYNCVRGRWTEFKLVMRSSFKLFSLYILGFLCVYCVPLPPLRGQYTVLCHPRWLPT